MATKLDVAEDNFKSFSKIRAIVKNIGKNGKEELDISEIQTNSDFRYFINKYDATCDCYLCKDLGEFKLRYDQKGGYSSKWDAPTISLISLIMKRIQIETTTIGLVIVTHAMQIDLINAYAASNNIIMFASSAVMTIVIEITLQEFKQAST